jgi:hypothetical protein
MVAKTTLYRASAGNDSDFEGRRRSRVMMMNHGPVLSFNLTSTRQWSCAQEEGKARKEFVES